MTEELAPRLLGLPFAVDLDERAVERISAAVARGLGTPVTGSPSENERSVAREFLERHPRSRHRRRTVGYLPGR